MSALQAYIKSVASVAGEHSVAGHILANGREFESQALTDRESEFISAIRWSERREKECWYNCQIEAMRLDGHPPDGITLRYVEGYVDIGGGFGIEHAWLSVNGKVVDPTLRTDDEPFRVKGLVPEGWSYYGVELEPRVCDVNVLDGEYGSLIDDWKRGWPLIPGRAAHRGRRTATDRQQEIRDLVRRELERAPDPTYRVTDELVSAVILDQSITSLTAHHPDDLAQWIVESATAIHHGDVPWPSATQ